MSTSSLFPAGMILAMAAAPAASAPLEAVRWEKRVALVFGEGEAVESQLSDLKGDQGALADRDMLVLRIAGETASAEWGEGVDALDAAELRDAYGVEEDAPFTVILLGKDGSEKLRRTEPVPAADIFGLIDSMPMRQSEANG
ncbi:MAG: hypothetical protein DI629_08165 [Mesorhizobium amorphae]|nr:MAG: hypothetical protein DI629_08165 [Mesorhizobium amorphae]